MWSFPCLTPSMSRTTTLNQVHTVQFAEFDIYFVMSMKEMYVMSCHVICYQLTLVVSTFQSIQKTSLLEK